MADELKAWKRELEKLTSEGNKVAKAKLAALKVLSTDSSSIQNWLAGMFWLSRKNASFKGAHKRISK